MNKIIKKKFTLQNIHNNYVLTDYVLNIFYYKQFTDLSHISMIRLAWQNLVIKLCSTIDLSESDDIIWKALIQKFEIKWYIWQELANHIFWQHSKNVYNKIITAKQAWANLWAQYESCSYYQLSVHISYFQSYFMLIYLSQDEWFSQEYNNYWKNKTQQ